jgi:glycosyltransferase involved in cell wall biosynthesis
LKQVKKRIIWLIDSLRPGGAEQLMPTLLSSFNKEQFDMRVCALQFKKGNPIATELRALGIPVDLVPIYSLKNPLNIFRILKYFNTHSPDLIHTQLEFSDILGTIAAKILRKPSVSTLHTLDVVKNYKFSAARQKLKWLVLNNFCDQNIAVSNHTRNHHIQNGNIPPPKIKTIYNGIQVSRFRDRNTSLLEEKKKDLNLNTYKKIITTIAVVREPKGIQYMINALPAIIEHHPETIYLIVGDGDHSASIRNMIARKNLDKNAIMLGHRTDIPDLLGISDLFVLPSLGDALPTVLIEALAAGVPVIATDVGGIPEIIENNKNGLLIPPADSESLVAACLKLMENDDDAKQLINAGLEKAHNQFDVSNQVKQLGNIYMELIK